jgi:hypothetical protein
MVGEKMLINLERVLWRNHKPHLIQLLFLKESLSQGYVPVMDRVK